MAHLLSDLSQSVFSSLGLADTGDSLLIGESPAARECIVLIDGMGSNAIAEYGEIFPINHAVVGSQPNSSSRWQPLK